MFNMSSSSGSSCSTAGVVPSENREDVSGCGHDSTTMIQQPSIMHQLKGNEQNFYYYDQNIPILSSL